MRRRVRWFLTGALLFALVLGTAGLSFAAQEWNVTGSGAISGLVSGTATFGLNAVVLVVTYGEIGPATGSFTYQDATSSIAIRGTIKEGIVLPKDPDFGGVDVAVLAGTYTSAQGPGSFAVFLEEGRAPGGGMGVALFNSPYPPSGSPFYANGTYPLISGRIRIFSQDQQGQDK